MKKRSRFIVLFTMIVCMVLSFVPARQVYAKRGVWKYTDWYDWSKQHNKMVTVYMGGFFNTTDAYYVNGVTGKMDWMVNQVKDKAANKKGYRTLSYDLYTLPWRNLSQEEWDKLLNYGIENKSYAGPGCNYAIIDRKTGKLLNGKFKKEVKAVCKEGKWANTAFLEDYTYVEPPVDTQKNVDSIYFGDHVFEGNTVTYPENYTKWDLVVVAPKMGNEFPAEKWDQFLKGKISFYKTSYYKAGESNYKILDLIGASKHKKEKFDYR